LSERKREGKGERKKEGKSTARRQPFLLCVLLFSHFYDAALVKEGGKRRTGKRLLAKSKGKRGKKGRREKMQPLV